MLIQGSLCWKGLWEGFQGRLRGLKEVAGVSVKTGGGLEKLHLRGVVKRGS